MFDLSFGEIVLVVLVAIVFIGPEDLPGILRAIARFMKQVRGMARELKGAFDELAEESGMKDE